MMVLFRQRAESGAGGLVEAERNTWIVVVGAHADFEVHRIDGACFHPGIVSSSIRRYPQKFEGLPNQNIVARRLRGIRHVTCFKDFWATPGLE